MSPPEANARPTPCPSTTLTEGSFAHSWRQLSKFGPTYSNGVNERVEHLPADRVQLLRSVQREDARAAALLVDQLAVADLASRFVPHVCRQERGSHMPNDMWPGS